ncbi:glycosyltransferase [uncultured Dubosiella sp.]|uniref:glycosyltransferase n=1 Tax=uncultured Dubosiella sp. TaxID=1937011 RepID=UPI0025B5412F|nr:glycosyltransferase [uncultured Dubosiella sp.]
MNYLILASSPYSHILPLKALADQLNKRPDTSLYCMSIEKNKNMIENFGMKFIAYPQGITPVSTNRVDMDKVVKRTNELWNKGEIEAGYEYFIDKDIESLYDITANQIQDLEKIIQELNIDILIRDAIDKFGHYLAKKLQLPLLGYITHNLYSKQFFESEPEYFYPIFLNALIGNRNKNISPSFYRSYWKKCSEIHEKHGREIGPFPLAPFHQFDPLTELTIIFSTDFLQPRRSLYAERNYLMVYPDIQIREIEKIPNDLKEFIEINEKIIYISSGSITTQSIKYYKNFISSLTSKGDYSLVVSVGKLFYKILKKYIEDESLIEKVYISEWIPQRYVLSHSSLFITSGGQNSILESIYYEVPMLITPMTSEQRINGIIAERIGVAYTTYNFRTDTISTAKMINTLLTKQEIKKNLKTFSDEYKSHINNFKKLDQYLDNIEYYGKRKF